MITTLPEAIIFFTNQYKDLQNELTEELLITGKLVAVNNAISYGADQNTIIATLGNGFYSTDENIKLLEENFSIEVINMIKYSNDLDDVSNFHDPKILMIILADAISILSVLSFKKFDDSRIEKYLERFFVLTTEACHDNRFSITSDIVKAHLQNVTRSFINMLPADPFHDAEMIKKRYKQYIELKRELNED